MTLGELKDRGEMPSATQVFFLEIEESKACGYSYGPHLYHCSPEGTTSGVRRNLCHRIVALHSALRRMFPGIELSE